MQRTEGLLMFEACLPISIYLVNSIAGSIYVQKFLRGKYRKKIVRFTWAGLYFIIRSLMPEMLDRAYPLNDLVGAFTDIV